MCTLRIVGILIQGLAFSQVFHEQYKWLETTFYVLIGLLPSLAIYEMHDTAGVEELRFGGAVYIAGVVFFKLDGVVPMAHAIWHLHVVVGALTHFNGVCKHLLPPEAMMAEKLQ